MVIICPHCNQSLIKKGKIRSCTTWHSFDESKEWYINLLKTNSSKIKGDESLMVIARHNFLETGLYSPLIKEIITIINNYSKTPITLLDWWCGEWRYLRQILHERSSNLPSKETPWTDTIIWIDIAKPAIKYASKNTPWTYIVWSTMDIPIANHSIDVFLSIFSPYNEEEIQRVLKPWWQVIIVSPWPEHLYKFIEMIRDTPHKHIIKSIEEKYNTLSLKRKEITFPLTINNNNIIKDLFMMTPYYWKAPKEKQNRILWLEHFESEGHFLIDY